jgi:hypothetical protein
MEFGWQSQNLNLVIKVYWKNLTILALGFRRVSTPKETPTNCGLCTIFLKELQIVYEEILNLHLSQQHKARIVKPILIHLRIYTSSMITSA